MAENNLPEVPEPQVLAKDSYTGEESIGYEADDLRSYALAAQVPLIERIKELERQNTELREALQEVVRISDRKHDAWDRAKAALATNQEQSK